MLTIPADLHAGHSGPVLLGAAGCVVAYRARAGSESVATLITQPTLVQVRCGTKVLHAPDGSEPLVVQQGRLVLMPAGMRLMSELLARERVYESTVISFDPAFLARAVPQLIEVRQELRRGACLLDPLPGLGDLVAALPESVHDDAERRLLELRLEEVALRLARGPSACRQLLAHGVRVGHGKGPARLQEVMRRHFHEPLLLADFATLCGRSLASFKRDFRRVYGVSPGSWLIEQRLAYATQLLAERGMSVTEACFACGFGNLSHFIRTFRRSYRASPKQWQLQQRA